MGSLLLPPFYNELLRVTIKEVPLRQIDVMDSLVKMWSGIRITDLIKCCSGQVWNNTPLPISTTSAISDKIPVQPSPQLHSNYSNKLVTYCHREYRYARQRFDIDKLDTVRLLLLSTTIRAEMVAGNRERSRHIV